MNILRQLPATDFLACVDQEMARELTPSCRVTWAVIEKDRDIETPFSHFDRPSLAVVCMSFKITHL